MRATTRKRWSTFRGKKRENAGYVYASECVVYVCVCRCETDYVRLYLDVEGAGIHSPANWSVELCGNDTQNGSDSGEFYSSSSRAILELHTGHHLRHRHHHRRQQQPQQHRQRRRPRFRGFRGTFRFLSKGQLHHTHTHTRCTRSRDGLMSDFQNRNDIYKLTSISS